MQPEGVDRGITKNEALGATDQASTSQIASKESLTGVCTLTLGKNIMATVTLSTRLYLIMAVALVAVFNSVKGACPPPPDNLTKDFNPELIVNGIDGSGLNLVGSNALLFINMKVSKYYYNLRYSYPNYCTSLPTYRQPVNTSLECDDIYYTQIAYTSVCNFKVADYPNDPSKLMFSGYMSIDANRDVNFLNRVVIQNYTTVRGFFILFPKTINVSNFIRVVRHACQTDADCNSGHVPSCGQCVMGEDDIKRCECNECCTGASCELYDVADRDGDGVGDCNDECPDNANKTAPGQCECDYPDVHSDADGIADCNDACPHDPAKWLSPGPCQCGVPDVDSDLDSCYDCDDACPNDMNKCPSVGVCGCGVIDVDLDQDGQYDCPLKSADGKACLLTGFPNCVDLCPQDPLKIVPGLCGCGVNDTDSDGDNTPDYCIDYCPDDAIKVAPGLCGCPNLDVNADNDGYYDCPQVSADGKTCLLTGYPNCVDVCPSDPYKIVPGVCGCGFLDTDSDGDNTPDCNDVCKYDRNKQTSIGDCGCGVPETDSDGDGFKNCQENCTNDPLKQNPGVCGCGQADTDTDGDGIPNCVDVCPNHVKLEPGVCGCPTPDVDTDSDGVMDCKDVCINDGTKAQDTNPAGPLYKGPCPCGVPNTDSDGDNVADCNEECDYDATKTDGLICGCGVSEVNTDGDGKKDCEEDCDTDPNKYIPGACGCGVADLDLDNDGQHACPQVSADGKACLTTGYPTCVDVCPNDPLKIVPGYCGCGVPDTDTDGDGTPDCDDKCPLHAHKTEAGVCGCPKPDVDQDNDGTPNCNDGCMADPLKTQPGRCGCGVLDTDTDADGTPNCHDDCPNDPAKNKTGVCGCGVADTDSDGDGTADCYDDCDSDPLKVKIGVCGCGVADTDTDGDQYADCDENCDTDPNKQSHGVCGCGVPDVNSDTDTKYDCQENCTADPLKFQPGVCGCGVSDADRDNDGVPDCIDVCPDDPTKHSSNGTCGCGVSENDDDGDAWKNCEEECDDDPAKRYAGLCGCGQVDVSSDQNGDGVLNSTDCNDECPGYQKFYPGVCGCPVADVDTDSDGTPDCIDGCPINATKTAAGLCGCDKVDPTTDLNGDGVCGCLVSDVDSDKDGTPDCDDGCPNDPYKIAEGICGCEQSDVDTDGDGVADCHDGCPSNPDKTAQGICGCYKPDDDADGDGFYDCVDVCPNDYTKHAGQGVCGCDRSDVDSDGDQTPDCDDYCPLNPTKTVPDACNCDDSVDTDGDGSYDYCPDNCPYDAYKLSVGICGCGVPDVNSDTDTKYDCQENCTADPFKFQPGVCGCGVSDADRDNDGVPDCIDVCPDDPTKHSSNGTCGCGVSENNDDGDAWKNCEEECDDDPAKRYAGLCGCGRSDVTLDQNGGDRNGDGVLNSADCNDECPGYQKFYPGVCGCTAADVDTDSDGTPDCKDGCPINALKTAAGLCGCDKCPTDPNKFYPGVCGCLVSDVDSDKDGTPDCNDGCPNDPLKIVPGQCGCGVVDCIPPLIVAPSNKTFYSCGAVVCTPGNVYGDDQFPANFNYPTYSDDDTKHIFVDGQWKNTSAYSSCTMPVCAPGQAATTVAGCPTCATNVNLVCSGVPTQILLLGQNNFSCTASDYYGNSATVNFHVTLIDNEPPVVIYCPPNANLLVGTLYNWNINANDDFTPDQSAEITWITSPLGRVGSAIAGEAELPLGVTEFSLQAFDNFTNSRIPWPSGCKFNVTVYDTYSYYPGAWGQCSQDCGPGFRTRYVVCKNSQGAIVADSFCNNAGLTKPITQEPCNLGACPQNVTLEAVLTRVQVTVDVSGPEDIFTLVVEFMTGVNQPHQVYNNDHVNLVGGDAVELVPLREGCVATYPESSTQYCFQTFRYTQLIECDQAELLLPFYLDTECTATSCPAGMERRWLTTLTMNAENYCQVQLSSVEILGLLIPVEPSYDHEGWRADRIADPAYPVPVKKELWAPQSEVMAFIPIWSTQVILQNLKVKNAKTTVYDNADMIGTPVLETDIVIDFVAQQDFSWYGYQSPYGFGQSGSSDSNLPPNPGSFENVNESYCYILWTEPADPAPGSDLYIRIDAEIEVYYLLRADRTGQGQPGIGRRRILRAVLEEGKPAKLMWMGQEMPAEMARRVLAQTEEASVAGTNTGSDFRFSASVPKNPVQAASGPQKLVQSVPAGVWIAAIVVLILGFLACVVIGAVCVCHWNKKAKMLNEEDEAMQVNIFKTPQVGASPLAVRSGRVLGQGHAAGNQREVADKQVELN
eukprot:g18286.t1